MKRWVIKAGSNMIVSGGPLLIRSWMQQVAALRKKHNIEVIWVTSGAIASAIERTGFEKKSRTLPEKQALSAIGQPMIMDLYNLSLQASGLLGAQVLLTSEDLESTIRKTNFQNTIETLLKWSVTPILNENDAISTDEIKFGDNDSLSSQVAVAMKADRLVILTDVDGLYDSDPKRNPNAKRIPILETLSPQLIAGTEKKAGSSRGTGGMYTKLLAAKNAQHFQIETWLVKGDHPQTLLQIAENHSIGTQISIQKNGEKRGLIRDSHS